MALACAATLALAACGDREVRLPGERFSIDIPLDQAIPGRALAADPSAGDAPRAITLPSPTRLGSWTMRGYNG